MPKHVIALLPLAMHWLLFCLFAALAEPTLNPKKTYEYEYEGVVRIGRDMADLAESGVKLQCTFKITGVSLQTFLLQIYNMVFEELNGIPGQSSFKPSPNLTKRLAAELNRPFTFEYSKGQIGDIKTAGEVSDTIVNIVRGILGFLHVTVKTTQRVYELNELGIHGVCHSVYAVEENAASKELYVTQIVDINDCRQKAAMYQGMALAEENKNSQQRGKNVVATVKYAYTVKSVEGGGLITKASAQERHHFTPFSVKGGNCKLKATRNIVLLKETDTVGKPVTGQVKNRGNLMYKMGKGAAPIPVVMIKLNDPVPKIADLIKRLAQDNIYQLNSTSSSDVFALIQLLRASTNDDLESLWKKLSGNNEHRRWFLDTAVEVTDGRVLKFLANRFKAGDISANEAGQALLVAFNHLTAEAELVESAKEFLTIPFSKSHPLLWNTVVLSYGSLVYRACAQETPCPVSTVQPLLDMANNGLAKKDDKDMVLALKALGNAGHPLSIKTILKFLPGLSVRSDSLSTWVQTVAVQSLRHLASRDPHSVQDIAKTLFEDRTLPAEIRMLASMILLETNPPLPVILAVAELLLQETDLQVVSFTYSQLRAISRSRTPDNQHLSVNPVEKIKIQISIGPENHKSELSEMTVTQLVEATDAAPEPVISVRVLAISPDVKEVGYEAAAYYTPAKQRDDIELIVSEVAEEVNWKICADLSVQKIQAEAKAHFKWGAECQTYEVALKVSTEGVTGPKPFLYAEINWEDVPSFMQALGQRVKEYLPGVSYIMGFYQKHEKNTEHEVSAMLVASTHEGFDVNVKIPEWCRTLEIAVECGVQKQCMELLATRPDPTIPPVEVTVYYESLCPGCRSFLTEQLFPTWMMLRDIMRVHLVPYGNTKELPERNSFSCQHGEPECQANIIEACILNVTDHAAFPVIHCMASSSDVIKAAPSCLQLYAPSVEWGTIESCVKGGLGHILMHENGVKTQSLSPAHTHVPWVTFNGVYTDDLEDKAMSTLFNLVCKLYEGIKPPVCTGALKKLNRSFC
ncbi:hypothetical protein AOLI_G00145340 [Acnodon oligacanthus]